MLKSNSNIIQNGQMVARIVKLERGDKNFQAMKPWAVMRVPAGFISQHRTKTDAEIEAKSRFPHSQVV
jgi:hypothetical protein